MNVVFQYWIIECTVGESVEREMGGEYVQPVGRKPTTRAKWGLNSFRYCCSVSALISARLFKIRIRDATGITLSYALALLKGHQLVDPSALHLQDKRIFFVSQLKHTLSCAMPWLFLERFVPYLWNRFLQLREDVLSVYLTRKDF